LFAIVQIGAGRTLTNGGNIVMSGTSSYTATLGDGGLNLQIINSSPGTIGSGGNIALGLGSLATSPAGALNLVVDNAGGRIQTGGNVSSTISGALTANFVNVQIDNRFKGFIGTGGNLSFTVSGTFTAANDANFTILNSQLGTTGGTFASAIALRLTLADTNIGNNLNAFIDNSDGSIGPTGNEGTVTLQVNGRLTVNGRINVFGTLNVTGGIMAGTLSATDVSAPSVSAGAGGITRFTFPNEATVNPLHTITTNALTSTGGINFNGPDFDTPPGFGPFDGGQLTINVPSLTFGASAADNIQGPVTFNGGSSPNTATPAGSGGTFNVNATGAITIGSAIQATTGLRPSGAETSGAGGTVNLNSTGGPIAVNSTVTVSSADPAGSVPGPRRRSGSGGNINLQSNAPTGVAINVSSTGQLLSLLDAAAPGPGGKITILATGANSRITVTGGTAGPGGVAPDSIRADRGSIDIRHTGLNGSISLTNSNIIADIVKVGALGNNGSLTIGGGVISADTILKLYAVGSNGAVNFISNVTLNGNSMKIIAGNSVTVNNNVIVTIGGGKPADVYVLDPKLANYSNFNGGNNSTNGMFILGGGGSPTSGAITHLGVAPPAFGPPGGP
jgi:fibronectin-binding autotransporter adhesin